MHVWDLLNFAFASFSTSQQQHLSMNKHATGESIELSTNKPTDMDMFSNKPYILGTAYYPDYLTESNNPIWDGAQVRSVDWQTKLEIDVQRMKKNGISLVRIGEFSWSHVEPHKGAKHVTERFLTFMDLALQNDIKVLMCTPTATPPKWLFDLHPDITAVTRDGYRMPFGTRRHYDPTSTTFQRESKRITLVYAQAFGSHTAVVGWQTDNEFGHHGSAFPFGDDAQVEFQKWLKQKYQDDIAKLNQEWFNCFWSQQYASFSEIPLPRKTWTDSNPHLELDFRRFASHSFCKFQRDQIDIIRKHSPGRWITHNFIPLFWDLDYYQLSQDLDIVGYDHYQVDPRPDPLSTVTQFALFSGLKPQSPYLILEQQPTQVNWQAVNGRIPLEWLFVWACQSKVYGAAGMCYFSFQKMYGGSEQFHDGVVPHDVRIPVSQQEKLLKAKQIFFDQWSTVIPSNVKLSKDVLVLDSVASRWTYEDITPQTSRWSCQDLVRRVAKMCTSSGLGMHIAENICQRNDLAEFKLVMIPGQAFEFTNTERSILKSYIDQGGRVVSLPRTGYKVSSGQMSPTPANFLNPTDFYLESYGALLEDEIDTFGDGMVGELWSEQICITAKDQWKVVANFESGPYRGSPAVIQHNFEGGGGSWVHLATVPKIDAQFTTWLWQVMNLEVKVLADESLHVYPLADKWTVVVNVTTKDQLISRIEGEVVLTGYVEHEELTLQSWDTSQSNVMPPLSVMVIKK